MLTRDQALAVYHSGPDATVALILSLQEELVELRQSVAMLSARVQELEAQLGKDSHNSSKPPSSDGLAKKPRSLRPGVGQSGRKTGGQPGHKGTTLEWREKPDAVIVHRPLVCCGCGEGLPADPCAGNAPGCNAIRGRRQVHDLPPQTLQVTEHQTLDQSCPHCHTISVGQFPAHVNRSVQYGPRVAGLCLYLHSFQLLPWARSAQLLHDVWGCGVSQGTLASWLQRANEALCPFEEKLLEALGGAPVVHFDESGVPVGGRLQWLHSISTQDLTFYTLHPKRGREAMDWCGVLPAYKGIAVHDALASYWGYTGCQHALCNAHLLRELIAQEEAGQAWAGALAQLLRAIKAAVERAREAGREQLEACERAHFEQLYWQSIESGLEQHPAPACSGRRGRTAQGAARNLVLRLQKRSQEVLRFLNDFGVPFDNNLAERDLRMIKVKTKVSGGFRSAQGGAQFCRIRSYISTVRKQQGPLLRALNSLFQGQLFWPPALP